jgi:type I restriction enzyme, R subunit
MSFTERNSVEHLFIQRLTGVNVQAPGAAQTVRDPGTAYQTPAWRYAPADQLRRDVTEVLLEAELQAALRRLNPAIARHPDYAEDVIHKLRAILITVANVGLVRANEEFATWLRNEHSLPLGPRGEHVKIRLIDYQDVTNNRYLLTNQFRVHARETKIPDLVLFINGIPVVVGELKTPARPAVSWYDAAHDIHDVYENAAPQLFVPNILSFASEGKQLFIGAVRTPLEQWAPWRLEDAGDELGYFAGLQDVSQQLSHLLKPATLLDILQYYSVYSTNRARKKIKVVCRYQQYEGANALVRRVVDGRVKKGLIWHFQGSGKTLLMLFAAQKLRRQAQLGNPTVLIVVDRTDLDSQIFASFAAADVANCIPTDSIRELHRLLERDTRKIIITMIHKFRDASPAMNQRENIIVMVDEAHRTQEGDLGRKMRAALPNAFLFGLTGTPINKADKNTFWAFGAEEDAGGYLSRYTFQDSLRDQATLPLHFEPRLPEYHIDKHALNTAFQEMANDLSEEERNTLSQRAARMNVFLKAPERVKAIAADVVEHYQQHVAPAGFKAMLVTPDRQACIQYKQALDALLPENRSRVVISTSVDDDFEFKQQWGVDKAEQEKIVEEFNDPNSALQLLIVTAKLLTGFNSPVLQTMYLDKSLKDHTLLQAICRTNRLFPQKTFGRIVDYFGVFDDTAQALAFDEESVKTVITNLQELRDALPESVQTCLAHFAGVDRSLEGFEGLQAAQAAINTPEKRDAFARDFSRLAKLWEALSPDDALDQFQPDYTWLSQVYTSVKPPADANGRLLWHALGAQTTALIHEHIHVSGVSHEMDELVLDAAVIDDLMTTQNPREAERVVNILVSRFRKHAGEPRFKALGDRLEALRDKAEQGLISSVEFIQQLCELARDTLRAERDVTTVQEQKSAKAALTELFSDMKTDQTPVIVERIVNDIDAIVKNVRFDGWKTSVTGERLVQQALRQTLLKYKLHKEETLFNRAYEYIKEYY